MNVRRIATVMNEGVVVDRSSLPVRRVLTDRYAAAVTPALPGSP